MRQVNLEGNPLPDVKASKETVEYRVFESSKFKLKARKDKLEEICLGDDEILTGFVQQRIRKVDKNEVLNDGDFDKGVQRIMKALRDQDERGWDA